MTPSQPKSGEMSNSKADSKADSKAFLSEGRSSSEDLPPAPCWIPVSERLPEPSHGSSYMEWITAAVAVIHADRPDYPIVAHAVLGNSLSARGVAIPTNGASKYAEIAWYSAACDTNNPFGLKDQDYTRFSPNRLGRRITHWMPLPPAPGESAGEVPPNEKAVDAFAALLAAAQCAANVLFLLQDEVKALGCNAKNVPQQLRAAIALATKEIQP